MGIKLEIADDYLTEVINHAASKLVGESMSAFENVSNHDELKKVIKNTIYQNFRDLEAQVRAFDCGVKFVNSKSLTRK